MNDQIKKFLIDYVLHLAKKSGVSNQITKEQQKKIEDYLNKLFESLQLTGEVMDFIKRPAVQHLIGKTILNIVMKPPSDERFIEAKIQTLIIGIEQVSIGQPTLKNTSLNNDEMIAHLSQLYHFILVDDWLINTNQRTEVMRELGRIIETIQRLKQLFVLGECQLADAINLLTFQRHFDTICTITKDSLLRNQYNKIFDKTFPKDFLDAKIQMFFDQELSGLEEAKDSSTAYEHQLMELLPTEDRGLKYDQEKNQLTAYEQKGISLLTCAANGIFLPKNAAEFLQGFLIYCFGHMELNAKLKSKSDEIHQIIRIISFKTRNLQFLDSAYSKIEKIQDMLMTDGDGSSLTEDEKLSLFEIGLFYDLSCLVDLFYRLEIAGSLKDNHYLSELYRKIKTIKSFVDQLEQKFNNEPKDYLKSGLIVGVSPQKYAEFSGKTFSYFESLKQQYITNYGHLAKIYRSERTVKVYHLNPEPRIDDFNLHDLLTLDSYEIILEQILTDSGRALLEKLYGNNWQQQLDNLYHSIEENIISNMMSGKYNDLEAGHRSREILSGLSQLFGRVKNKPNNWEDIRRKFFGASKVIQEKTKMLCSEFVALSVVAGLKELEWQLCERASAQGYEFELPLLNVPFDLHEDFTKMHPQRVIEELKKRKCLKLVEPKSFVNKILKK